MMVWKIITIGNNKTNYGVNNIGDIRNNKTGAILKPYISKHGYVKINIYHDNKRYTRLVHRLVAEVFIPNPNNLPQVNHINGIKTDNRVENLEWVSSGDNIKHAFANGLKTQYGMDNPANKYSEEDIITACELLQSRNYTCRDVSEITGIDITTIGHISRKERWKNVTEKYNLSNIKRKYIDHSEIRNSVDRAIQNGKSRKEIVKVLMNYGLTKTQATNLYRRRKESIKLGKSLVQNTIYIDEGIEIF